MGTGITRNTDTFQAVKNSNNNRVQYFCLDKFPAKFRWDKSCYYTCEDKSCPFCVFDEKFSKYYQQLVILKTASTRKHWHREKQARELTAYYMMFIQKN